MPKDSSITLRDMLASAQFILDVATPSVMDALNDPVKRAAVLYHFIVIGEAVGRIPDDTKAQHPEVDWRGARDFRNVVAHRYDSIVDETLVDIIKVDLPELAGAIEAVLYDMGSVDC